jgi:hypothetical protein
MHEKFAERSGQTVAVSCEYTRDARPACLVLIWTCWAENREIPNEGAKFCEVAAICPLVAKTEIPNATQRQVASDKMDFQLGSK